MRSPERHVPEQPKYLKLHGTETSVFWSAYSGHMISTVSLLRTHRDEILLAWEHQVAALPPGLIFGPLELGPSLLALTPHSVIGAGYHRADKSIVFEEAVMRGEVDAARERLRERGVAYVMTCADFPAYPNPDSFYNALLSDTAGAWLERVPLPDDNVLRIWRVRG